MTIPLSHTLITHQLNPWIWFSWDYSFKSTFKPTLKQWRYLIADLSSQYFWNTKFVLLKQTRLEAKSSDKSFLVGWNLTWLIEFIQFIRFDC